MSNYKKAVIDISGRIISKKNSKQMVMNYSTGKMFPVSSTAYKKFEKRVLVELEKHSVQFIGGVHVDYVFEMKGKLDTDLDNMQASVNDVLQESGIIDDDKNIVEISAKKIAGCKDFNAQITIIQFSD